MVSRKSVIAFGMVAIQLLCMQPHRIMIYILINCTRKTTVASAIKRRAHRGKRD